MCSEAHLRHGLADSVCKLLLKAKAATTCGHVSCPGQCAYPESVCLCIVHAVSGIMVLVASTLMSTTHSLY